MSNIIEQIEKEQQAKLADKPIPEFGPGDTVVVQVKVKEGNRERLQAFEGVVIAKRNRGLNSSFTVRKISHGEGVERVFPLYSPLVEEISVKRRGKVRRAKLYYLRERRGKAARIKEKIGRRRPILHHTANPLRPTAGHCSGACVGRSGMVSRPPHATRRKPGSGCGMRPDPGLFSRSNFPLRSQPRP